MQEAALINGIKEELAKIDAEQNQAQLGIPLLDKLIANYTQRIKSQLSDLLSNADAEPPIATKLTELLASNWQLIKSEHLCYTAYPQLTVNQILFRLATALAEHINTGLAIPEHKTPIQLLMPDLNFESEDFKFPNFIVTADEWTEDDDRHFKRLSGLEARKQLTKEDASELRTLKEKQRSVAAMRSHAKLLDGYLVPQYSLEQVIATHILSDDATYLIPVALLLKEELTCSPYDGAYKPLSKTEIDRLWQHSPATHSLYEAKQQLTEILDCNNNLLSNLRDLCAKLKFNDAHAGLGTKYDAGAGAYIAIEKFKNFYGLPWFREGKAAGGASKSKTDLGQLSNKQYADIPHNLKKAINALLEKAYDFSKNPNAPKNVQTCIGTRRKYIERAMNGLDEELAAISVNKKDNQSLTQQAFAAIKNDKAILQQLLNTKIYKGRDYFSLSPQLLQEFAVKISIQCLGGLNTFMQLPPNAIYELAQEEEVNKQICTTIVNGNHFFTDSFVPFVLEHSAIKLKALFDAIRTELYQRFTEEQMRGLAEMMEEDRKQLIYDEIDLKQHGSLIVAAVVRNDLKKLAKELTMLQLPSNGRDAYLEKAFMLAVKHLNKDAMQLILKHFPKTNVSLTQTKAITDINRIVDRERLDILQLLVEHPGFDINYCYQTTGESHTLLSYAIYYSKTTIVRYLLTIDDIDINQDVNETKDSVLHIAAARRVKVERFQMLIQDPRALINKANEKGKTPLIIATQHGQIEKVKILLAHDEVVIPALTSIYPEKNKHLFLHCNNKAICFATIAVHSLLMGGFKTLFKEDKQIIESSLKHRNFTPPFMTNLFNMASAKWIKDNFKALEGLLINHAFNRNWNLISYIEDKQKADIIYAEIEKPERDIKTEFLIELAEAGAGQGTEFQLQNLLNHGALIKATDEQKYLFIKIYLTRNTINVSFFAKLIQNPIYNLDPPKLLAIAIADKKTPYENKKSAMVEIIKLYKTIDQQIIDLLIDSLGKKINLVAFAILNIPGAAQAISEYTGYKNRLLLNLVLPRPCQNMNDNRIILIAILQQQFEINYQLPLKELQIIARAYDNDIFLLESTNKKINFKAIIPPQELIRRWAVTKKHDLFFACNGFSILMLAVITSNIDFVKLLLTHINININLSVFGITALKLAHMIDNIFIVNLLLDAGAQLNKKTIYK